MSARNRAVLLAVIHRQEWHAADRTITHALSYGMREARRIGTPGLSNPRDQSWGAIRLCSPITRCDAKPRNRRIRTPAVIAASVRASQIAGFFRKMRVSRSWLLMIDGERLRVVSICRIINGLPTQPTRKALGFLVCVQFAPASTSAPCVLTHQAGLGVDAVALHDGHCQTTTPEDSTRLGAGLGGHCRRWCSFVWIMSTSRGIVRRHRRECRILARCRC